MKVAAPFFLVAVLAIASAMAGCTDRSDPGADGPAPGGPSGAGSSGTVSSGPTTPGGAPAILDWSLPECRQLRTTIRQEKEAASEGLPPDHELQGEGVAILDLLVLDCPAAVVGNVSVVRGFRAAFLYHLLQPFSDNPNEEDGFLREAVVSDAATAAALVAWGLPTVVGSIELAPVGEAWSLVIDGPGMQVEVTGAPPTAELQPSDRSGVLRYRGGDASTWYWLEDGFQETASRQGSDPVLVQASAGYLADGFPLGLTVGVIVEATGSHHWVLGRQVFT
ncbi:MAG: hypothetical protein QOG31_1668 [Thermoplasmata archaeon]|nr:hypothetical protein [Thermoplasmata archaeon]